MKLYAYKKLMSLLLPMLLCIPFFSYTADRRKRYHSLSPLPTIQEDAVFEEKQKDPTSSLELRYCIVENLAAVYPHALPGITVTNIQETLQKHRQDVDYLTTIHKRLQYIKALKNSQTYTQSEALVKTNKLAINVALHILHNQKLTALLEI